MARQVINKHVSNASDIHYLNFEYLGEIVICNEAGNEGIYVINTNHEPVKIGSWSGDIDVDTDRIIQDLKSWVTANFASASDITYLQEQIDNISIEIDEEKVKEIVNGEIEKLVDSASTDFNTLGKIERWIKEHPSDVDPQLIEDIENLKAISADTRINALEESSVEENNRLHELETISANTRLENLESLDIETRISDLESISANTRINELETLSAGTRLETIEEKIDGIVKSTDHFVMTYQQYMTLIASGSVVVDGEYIHYSDDYFYCIYESEEPEPTPEPESGGTIISGDTVIFGDEYPYDDGSTTGEEPSIYIGEIEFDDEDGVVIVDWFGGEGGGDDTPGDIEVDGDTVTVDDNDYNPGSETDEPSVYIGEIEFGNEEGVVEVPWEVDIQADEDVPSGDNSNIDDIINGSTRTFEAEGVEINSDGVNTLTLPDSFSVDNNENGIITIE